MIHPSKPPAERRPDDIVDAYLADRFGVGLEQILLDAICGVVTPAAAGAVTVEAKLASRWPYADGGLAEHFEGMLTVEGMDYVFRCTAYSVPDAYVARFLTDVSHFEPTGWAAGIQIEAARA